MDLGYGLAYEPVNAFFLLKAKLKKQSSSFDTFWSICRSFYFMVVFFLDLFSSRNFDLCFYSFSVFFPVCWCV